jgi:hypothetical protein
LEQARSQQPDAGGAVSILEDGQVKQVLSYRTKTLEELLRELIGCVESPYGGGIHCFTARLML